MKVSGSILAVRTNYLEYARMLKYAKIDYLHIDIFQDEKDFALADILNFDSTYLPLDVHLIFNEITDDQIDILNCANVRYLSVQYENLKDKCIIKHLSEKFNGNLGIAITSKTLVDVVDNYLNDITHVLFMCSEPGISGASFDDSNYERIESLHDRYPSLSLFADGGINNIIGKKMEKLGIEMVVSGSYLCKDMQQLGNNAYSLKYMNEQSVNVTRVMIKYSFLPIIDMNSTFMDIINVMNHYRLGLVMTVKNGKLCGVITDGDIRRGYIRYGEDIFKKKASDLINANPFTIDCNKSVEDIYSELLTMRKGIDVVPVLENGQLIGAVDLRIGI